MEVTALQYIVEKNLSYTWVRRSAPERMDRIDYAEELEAGNVNVREWCRLQNILFIKRSVHFVRYYSGVHRSVANSMFIPFSLCESFLL